MHAGKGGNTDTVTGTSAATTLYAGTGAACAVAVQATTAPLTINGNDLENKITIGSSAPDLGGILANIAGSITVANTADDSTLILDDSGDGNGHTGTIAAKSVTGFGMKTGVAVYYTGSQIGTLTVYGGKGANTETVTGTSAATTLYAGAKAASKVNVQATTAPLTINGGGFEDTISIGGLAPTMGGTLTNIAGSITVANTAHDSTLILDDSGDGTGRTGTIAAKSVTGFGMPSGVAVKYTGSQIGTLSVYGGKGANTETVTGTSAATTLYAGA